MPLPTGENVLVEPQLQNDYVSLKPGYRLGCIRRSWNITTKLNIKMGRQTHLMGFSQNSRTFKGQEKYKTIEIVVMFQIVWSLSLWLSGFYQSFNCTGLFEDIEEMSTTSYYKFTGSHL